MEMQKSTFLVYSEFVLKSNLNLNSGKNSNPLKNRAQIAFLLKAHRQ